MLRKGPKNYIIISSRSLLEKRNYTQTKAQPDNAGSFQQLTQTEGHNFSRDHKTSIDNRVHGARGDPEQALFSEIISSMEQEKSDWLCLSDISNVLHYLTRCTLSFWQRLGGKLKMFCLKFTLAKNGGNYKYHFI